MQLPRRLPPLRAPPPISYFSSSFLFYYIRPLSRFLLSSLSSFSLFRFVFIPSVSRTTRRHGSTARNFTLARYPGYQCYFTVRGMWLWRKSFFREALKIDRRRVWVLSVSSCNVEFVCSRVSGVYVRPREINGWLGLIFQRLWFASGKSRWMLPACNVQCNKGLRIIWLSPIQLKIKVNYAGKGRLNNIKIRNNISIFYHKTP